MDAKFKKGDAVQQAMPAPFKGVIVDLRMDADSGEIQYLVDPDGDPNTPGQRWFSGAQVEAQPKPEGEEEAAS